jgi:hypothetical protein
MKKCFRGLCCLLGGIAIFAALGAVTMWLWNWLLPDIFGITTICYCQALGILALAKILFSGFGFGRHHSCHHHGRRHYHNAMREKWLAMNEDERKEFLKKHRCHCGFGHDFSSDKNSGNGEKESK